MTIKTYKFADGKYEFDRDTDTSFILNCRRNGEDWPAGIHGFQHNNCVHAMLNYIDELEEQLKAARGSNQN